MTGSDQGSLTRTLKDLFAGAVGGIAQVLIGLFACLWGSYEEWIGLGWAGANDFICLQDNLLVRFLLPQRRVPLLAVGRKAWDWRRVTDPYFQILLRLGCRLLHSMLVH